MAPKLTIAEKEARGTRTKADLARVRPLLEVQEEINDTMVSLDDARYNLRKAGEAIRKYGVLIDVVTRNNGGDEVRTKKLNPACRLQRDMLTAIKAIKRALVLLREEETLAQKKVTPEKDEFEGLA